MNRAFCLFILVATTLMVTQANARGYHYGAVTDTDVLDCDKLAWSSARNQAASCYQTILRGNKNALNRAEAAWALGDAKQANEHFKQAAVEQADDSMVLVRWGDLYYSTHQLAEAQKLYAEASALNIENRWADLGTAIALSDSHDPAGKAYLEALLSDENLDPGIHLKTLLISAFQQLENNNLSDAITTLSKAEEIASNNNLSAAEINALYAAHAIRDDQSPQPFIDKSLSEDPGFGDAYAIPAYFYMITFRYDETGEYYQKAVDTQPDHWTAHLELGANHLRQNRAKAAREHFEIAYSGDPFNPAIVNSNRMIDTYDTFEVINYPTEADGKTLPVVSLRLDTTEADVLAPYAGTLAEQAITTLAKRYKYPLKNTATLEIYPNHEDFIVRTLGMPGVGLLGVAFGDVIAMDSPTAQAGNDYHWGTTLWHEVAHIFTLKASNHRVPRWFTEGISVFEEWRTGPLPGMRVPASVWNSLQEHEFLAIAELDSGFVRPSYDNQVIVSYMQGGLICDFIDTKYGFDKLLGLLTAYRDGLKTVEAIEKVLDLTPDQFDQQFQSYYQQNFAQIPEALPAFLELLKKSAEQLNEKSWQLAIDTADQAITLIPSFIEPDNPYLIKAAAQAELSATEQQQQTLMTYWQTGGHDPDALLKLAQLLLKADNKDQAIKVLQAYHLVDPFNLDSHQSLGNLLLDSGDAAGALQEFQVTLALNPLDKAASHYNLANANEVLGNPDVARKHVLAALEIAPHYRPAQKLLKKLLQK